MSIKKLFFILSITILGLQFSFAAITINLNRGMENSQVKELQTFLVNSGFLKATPNGYFGPATFTAVKAFQKANGISQLGNVGPATRAKINSLKTSNNSTNSSATNSNKTTTNTNIHFSVTIQAILNKSFTVAAWVPYWQKTAGSKQVIENINKIDIVSPFSYEMEETGTFKDPMKMMQEPYKSMIDTAHKNGKLVIPSILWWADGEKERGDVDFVLKDADLRGSVIFDIMTAIKNNNLDGIDIDYENKKADTRDAFSTFLTELSTELHKNGKVLTCTIESRTPLDGSYAMATNTEAAALAQVGYSNDFITIGKVCDQVRIMAYDQGSADKDLNMLHTGPYKPVADIEWVKKVLTLAMRDIPWNKIILGVPTYGNKYEITRDSSGNISSYRKIGSMNWFYADEEATNKKITPTRHSSGELNYTYIDPATQKEYLIWYSDAEAIRQKTELAKLYKIGGIAIFKIDGNNDKSVWNKI